MLIIRRSGNARQRNRSWLRGDDTSPAGLADRPAAADVEGYQIGDRVEGFIFELILRSLVNRVWLNYDPIDDEMKRLAFPSYGQNVIAGLGGAIAHQEVAVIRHFRFRALPTAAQRTTVVPGVRS